MTQSVRFSIILPVFNVSNYIRTCLDSIINQAYKNYEVICVNDGSTDNSLDILNEYAAKDNRIKVFTQENQGQGCARNKGIDIASGEYIMFVDPDDYIANNCLETLANNLFDNMVDIVQFDYKTFNDNSGKVNLRSFSKDAKKSMQFNIHGGVIYNWNKIKNKNLLYLPIAVWNKVYSAKFIKDNNIRFALNKFGEDHIFSIPAMLLAKDILYLQSALYYYRIREGSSINKASDGNFCIFENVALVKQFLITHNLYEEYKEAYSRYLVNALYWHYTCIPEKSSELYQQKCASILTPKEFKQYTKCLKGQFSFWENIFSLKNRKENGKKIKFVKFLGFTFDIPR